LRRAAIVSALRTPIGAFGGALRPLSAAALCVHVIQAVLKRSKLDPARIDEVIVAQSYSSSEAPCLGRFGALAADLPIEVPG
jgi:acetyl-CoA C-acetyltransferase